MPDKPSRHYGGMDLVTITTQVTKQDAEILTHWASVGRTLGTIEDLLTEGTWEGDREEQALFTLQELQAIRRPLENLHLSWRSNHWKWKQELNKIT